MDFYLSRQFNQNEVSLTSIKPARVDWLVYLGVDMGIRKRELLVVQDSKVHDAALVDLEELQHEARINSVRMFIESWFASRHIDVSVEFQAIHGGSFVGDFVGHFDFDVHESILHGENSTV
jgi:hypothetical protein